MKRNACGPRLFAAVTSAGLALLLNIAESSAQEITRGSVTARAARQQDQFVGFDLASDGATVATARFSSAPVRWRAAKCEISADGSALIFSRFAARADCGLEFGQDDSIRVSFAGQARYPTVAFRLTIARFDPNRWKAAVGEAPFHFLALYLPQAEAWHQRGWLNATPLSDPFPLLLDRHAGTPEISAYHYNRSWSYTPPLGANPLPVIGLWAPRVGRYVGLEFQTTRLDDNSEKEIATGYHWEKSPPNSAADQGQFVALVYPYGGDGYQQLVFPKAGAKLKSRGTLLWSRALFATNDPNRFVWSYLWPRIENQLAGVPQAADVSWIPGGIRLDDFQGPPAGDVAGGVERPFQKPGAKLIYGWTWHNESPTAAPARQGDSARLNFLERKAAELLTFAKKFDAGGDRCIYWEKPLEGEWTEAWGGKAVTTLHNANGFAAGRLFLGLYRDLGKTEYLPVVDGVLNWAKHIAWTRNEFADVPSSPFAIGGTLSASFCLDYYSTFRDSPDPAHRRRAAEALDLAHSLTYRYMVMWPSDNNRQDNLDSTFLWEPNSGRDWTGAACANEVFWNLDTLAQTAVATGDPVLMWALEGSLSRWHLLYQDVYKNSLADYLPGDMTEGYGLYPGNIYGVGARAPYGFAAPLVMTEPVGRASARVLAGEKAALAFRKTPQAFAVSDYQFAPGGDLSFVIRSAQPTFDLALTVPYHDISRKSAAIVRAGKRIELKPGVDFLRPPQALWSLYFKAVEANDQIIVGELGANLSALPSAPPLAQNSFWGKPAKRRYRLPPGFLDLAVPHNFDPDRNWEHKDSWAGSPRGLAWYFDVPFVASSADGACAEVGPNRQRFSKPIDGEDFLYLLYSDGPGEAPSAVFDDGASAPIAREALAWRAWPPIYTARLIMGEIPLRGRAVAAIDPGQRAIWAETAVRTSAERPDALQERLAAFGQGVAAWETLRKEEAEKASLRKLVAEIPEGAVAILPPSPGGPAFALAQQIGLTERARILTPAQLVDPNFFNARRMPVALYLDGENYLGAVRSLGDGANAVVRYVNEGGTLALLASQPWPLYYDIGRGAHRPAPLTQRLGLPLEMAVEGVPAAALTVELNDLRASEAWAQPIGFESIPYPPGDPRLRSIPPGPKENHYLRIATVASASGKNYGDAAGLIRKPGGGRIFYMASVLTRDPRHGFDFLDAAFRFVCEASQRRP